MIKFKLIKQRSNSLNKVAVQRYLEHICRRAPTFSALQEQSQLFDLTLSTFFFKLTTKICLFAFVNPNSTFVIVLVQLLHLAKTSSQYFSVFVKMLSIFRNEIKNQEAKFNENAELTKVAPSFWWLYLEKKRAKNLKH